MLLGMVQYSWIQATVGSSSFMHWKIWFFLGAKLLTFHERIRAPDTGATSLINFIDFTSTPEPNTKISYTFKQQKTQKKTILNTEKKSAGPSHLRFITVNNITDDGNLSTSEPILSHFESKKSLGKNRY